MTRYYVFGDWAGEMHVKDQEVFSDLIEEAKDLAKTEAEAQRVETAAERWIQLEAVNADDARRQGRAILRNAWWEKRVVRTKVDKAEASEK